MTYQQISDFYKTCLLGCFLALAGCNSNEKVDHTGALAKEMKSKQIKRITAADVTLATHKAGENIAATATRALEKSLQNESKDCLTSESIKLLDPLRQRFGVKIGLLFPKDTANPGLYQKEPGLLKAYHYQTVHNLPLSDNLQKINDTISVYYSPVAGGSLILKNCEESQGASFVLWRIVLNQKDVIKNMDI